METLQRRSPPAGMTAELEFMAGFRFLSKKNETPPSIVGTARYPFERYRIST